MRTRSALVLLGVCLGLAACAATATPGAGPSIAALQRAQEAARLHDGPATMAALTDAENAWLTTDAARSNPCMYNASPELRAIGNARASVQSARWEDAEYYIATAFTGIGSPR